MSSLLDENIRQHASGHLYGAVHEQGVLTAIGIPDDADVHSRTRMKNGRRYPGASEPLNLSVQERELVFAPVKRTSVNVDAIPGVFSSLSGLSIEEYRSLSELENNFYLVGVARSDYTVQPSLRRGSKEPRHGFAIVVHGSTTVWTYCMEDIYPGDVLIWCFPTYAEAQRLITQRTTLQTGVEKIKPYLRPLRWEMTHYYLHAVLRLLLRKQNDIGRIGVVVDTTGYTTDNRQNSSQVPEVRAARALKRHGNALVSKGVQVLATRGVVTINTPHKVAKQNAKEKLLIALLKNLENGTGSIRGERELPENAGSANIAMVKAYNAYVKELKSIPQETNPSGAIDDRANAPSRFSKEPFSKHASGVVYVKKRSEIGDAVTPKGLEKELRQRVSDQLWLNGQLGLIDRGNREEKVLTRDILYAAYGAAGDGESAREYDLVSYVSDPTTSLGTKTQLFIEESERNTQGAVVELMESVTSAYENLRRKRVGRALTSLKAGPLEGRVDILLDPHS